jgi:hypothetical protein
MEHWFDRLAAPQTRRTTLKAAAVAAAGLVLPLSRVPRARATQSEACAKECVAAAQKSWDTAADACYAGGSRDGYKTFALLVYGQVPAAFIDGYLGAQRKVSCLAEAELKGRREGDRCNGPECGDPSKYPGGNPIGRPPGCDDGYILCGERCCNTANAYCQGCNGVPTCCVAGGNCCPG